MMYAVSFLSFYVLIKCSLVLVVIASFIFKGLGFQIQNVF